MKKKHEPAISSVLVFCGSSEKSSPIYKQQAALLGQAFAQLNLTIVYGGASIGLMGALANSSLRDGGKVIGVIPKAIANLEIAHNNLTEIHFVDSMHERKMNMFNRADSILVLPGGFGTMDEFLEALTWKQLAYHNKSIVLFNFEGFFDELLNFFDKMIEKGFLDSMHLSLFSVAKTTEEVLVKLISPGEKPDFSGKKWWLA